MTSGTIEDCCEICNTCTSVFKQAARISTTTVASPARSRSTLGPAIDKENSTGHILSPRRLNSKSCLSPMRKRTALEDNCDANSRDSGLEMSADPATFRFAEPLSVAPRKTTPRKEMAPQCLSPVSPRAVKGGTSLFHCLSSGSESIDDGFLEFLTMDKEVRQDDDANFPTGMGSLLSGKIMRPSPQKCKSTSGGKSAKRSLHRSLSMADCDTPVTSKVRSCLFKSPSAENMVESPSVALLGGGFKRPEPPTSLEALCSPNQPAKKRKASHTSPSGMITFRSYSENAVTTSIPRGTLTQSSLLNYGFQRSKPVSAIKFQRSFSESEATIKNALQRSMTEPDLIGDFTRPYVLPLMEGRHADLKTITPETLASLMQGHYSESVQSYSIVDCRYPYEYQGGHIKGSRNLFTKDLVNDALVNNSQPPRHKHQRHIIVFHCEFSSERAPSMSRYLRNVDRDVNKECYPQLHYPEMYLLHGGYKAFYESHSQLCDPSGYIPMLNQGNEADLRHFRAKSRSWAGDIKNTASRLPPKFSLKRLDV